MSQLVPLAQWMMTSAQELWRWSIQHPGVFLPLLIAMTRLTITLAPCLKTRDWFSSYGVLAQLGVDLSFVAFSVYLGTTINGYTAVTARLAGPTASERDRAMAVIAIGFMLFLVLAIAMGLTAWAKTIGRERVAIVYKTGAVATIVTPDVSSMMFSAVTKHALFSANQGTLVGGLACVALGLSCGVLDLWVVVQLTMV